MNYWTTVLLWTAFGVGVTLLLDRLSNGVWIDGKWPLFYVILNLIWWMWIFRDMARSSTG